MEEKWKDIEGFEGLYKVSNTGLVKSVRRPKHNVPNAFVQEKIISINKIGHVHLFKEAVRMSLHVPFLVAKAFVKNPKKWDKIHYKNGNCMDFVCTNLKWSNKVFCNRKDKRNIYRNLV